MERYTDEWFKAMREYQGKDSMCDDCTMNIVAFDYFIANHLRSECPIASCSYPIVAEEDKLLHGVIHSCMNKELTAVAVNTFCIENQCSHKDSPTYRIRTGDVRDYTASGLEKRLSDAQKETLFNIRTYFFNASGLEKRLSDAQKETLFNIRTYFFNVPERFPITVDGSNGNANIFRSIQTHLLNNDLPLSFMRKGEDYDRSVNKFTV